MDVVPVKKYSKRDTRCEQNRRMCNVHYYLVYKKELKIHTIVFYCTHSNKITTVQTSEVWQRYDAVCQLPVREDEACELSSASYFMCQYRNRSTTFRTSSSG